MKNFLAIFTGSPAGMDAWSSLDAAQRQAKEKAGMAAWKSWADKNQASIVDQGAPLGKTKRISTDGIGDMADALKGMQQAIEELDQKLAGN